MTHLKMTVGGIMLSIVVFICSEEFNDFISRLDVIVIIH